MRIFVTGASGFIGSAVVPDLLAHGHEVLGLARSDEKVAAIAAMGAEVHRGSLEDLASLTAGAQTSDGVIHLAFKHDFSEMQAAARTDLAAIEALVAGLEGRDAPLAIASGFAGLQKAGDLATEDDQPAPDQVPRAAGAAAALAAAQRGVRSAVVRLAPTVHGPNDHGFVATLVEIARTSGVSAYVGDGANRWPALHVQDAASLFRLTIERAPASAVLHGAGEEGVPAKAIAEAIGAQLSLPVQSVAPGAEAEDHFGWVAAFFGADRAASSARTQELLGWKPTCPTLLEDLAAGHYTTS